MRKHESKNIVYVGFMDLEKANDRVDREALWQVLRIFDVGGKLLNGNKSSMSSLCQTKGDESEWFRTDSSVRHGCIMFPRLLNVYMDAVKKVKMGD